jgi:UDP-N-acetyl-D-mannosaminuronic acid dehydrogenase
MQLAAFDNNRFNLGYAAMMINEGLPNYIIESLKRKYVLNLSKVGILGMAFKAEVDDIRDSLSYKLGKILRFSGADVHYSDEYAKDPTFVTKEEILEKCNIVIIGAPHHAYKDLKFSPYTEVVDIWGMYQDKKLQGQTSSAKIS